MRAAGRASTEGTSTAHTVVDRVNGIHNNSNCGTDQVAAPVSTTNYQTVSLSNKLSNYKQRSERYKPLILILITHRGTREI